MTKAIKLALTILFALGLVLIRSLQATVTLAILEKSTKTIMHLQRFAIRIFRIRVRPVQGPRPIRSGFSA